MNLSGKIVYSTENDGKCKKCGKPFRKCICKRENMKKKPMKRLESKNHQREEEEKPFQSLKDFL